MAHKCGVNYYSGEQPLSHEFAVPGTFGDYLAVLQQTSELVAMAREMAIGMAKTAGAGECPKEEEENCSHKEWDIGIEVDKLKWEKQPKVVGGHNVTVWEFSCIVKWNVCVRCSPGRPGPLPPDPFMLWSYDEVKAKCK